MKRTIARVVLRLTRVAIAAPRTSNGELSYLLMYGWYHDVDMSWLEGLAPPDNPGRPSSAEPSEIGTYASDHPLQFRVRESGEDEGIGEVRPGF